MKEEKVRIKAFKKEFPFLNDIELQWEDCKSIQVKKIDKNLLLRKDYLNLEIPIVFFKEMPQKYDRIDIGENESIAYCLADKNFSIDSVYVVLIEFDLEDNFEIQIFKPNLKIDLKKIIGTLLKQKGGRSWT